MVTKIFSFISIACLGAALAVAYLKVEPRIKTAEADAKQKGEQLDAETAAKQKVQGELDQTKTNLASMTTERDNFKAASEKSASEAQAAKGEAEQANNKLAGVTQEYEQFKSDHADFVKLNMKAPEILKMKADLAKTIVDRDTFKKENEVLALTIKQRDAKIAKLDKPGPIPALPDGLTGKVVAVDPRYQFVVLNIGLKQGVKMFGEMVISRGGKLIGKVQITEVEPDICIGSIVQKWKDSTKQDIVEGDLAEVAGRVAAQ